MTDKELKHLSRAELIDIIYEQQKRLEEQMTASAALQSKLDEKELHVSNAGSIAEAALKVNGVFESAQAAAEQYLASIKAAEVDMEQRAAEAEAKRQKLLSDAEAQSAEMIRQAEIQAASINAIAEKQSAEKWKKFDRRAQEQIEAYNEWKNLTGGGSV